MVLKGQRVGVNQISAETVADVILRKRQRTVE